MHKTKLIVWKYILNELGQTGKQQYGNMFRNLQESVQPFKLTASQLVFPESERESREERERGDLK